jgi:glycosyltransferase involved in cell wall biosynthesis
VATILLVSEASLLDGRSGVARSISEMLQALSAVGHECHAVTMSTFEAGDKEPVPDDLANAPQQTVSLLRDGIPQTIYRTASRNIRALSDAELAGFMRLALDEVRRLRPDIVLIHSASGLWPVLRYARLQGAVTAVYLANTGWTERDGTEIHHIDRFIAPSQALATYFCEKTGVAQDRVKVIRDIITPLMEAPLPSERASGRADRFITMIDPQPGKGGGFLLHLAAHAMRRAPNLRFMVVEGRWGRADWAAGGLRIGDLDNISWLPAPANMATIYRHSALLLMPSLQFEAGGRRATEALQCGVPVLAMDTGALAEAIDGGGFLFDCPAELASNPLAVPSSFLADKWLHLIKTLMRDDAQYGAAVERALNAGARASLRRRRNAAAAAFDELLEDRAVSDHPVATSEERGVRDHPSVIEAVRLLKDGGGEQARTILEAHVRTAPQDAGATLLLADLIARQGDLWVAYALAHQANDLAPSTDESRAAVVHFAGLLEAWEGSIAAGDGAPDRQARLASTLNAIGAAEAAPNTPYEAPETPRHNEGRT